jgi:hypothetical protein
MGLLPFQRPWCGPGDRFDPGSDWSGLMLLGF